MVEKKEVEIVSPVGFNMTASGPFGSRPNTADAEANKGETDGESVPAGSASQAVATLRNKPSGGLLDEGTGVSMFQSRFFNEERPKLSKFSGTGSSRSGGGGDEFGGGTRPKTAPAPTRSTPAIARKKKSSAPTAKPSTPPSSNNKNNNNNPSCNIPSNNHTFTLSPSSEYTTFGTPNLRLPNTIHSFSPEDISAHRTANEELLLSELIAQTYRLIQKCLPWQAQMCPRAFEDLEILRFRHLTNIEEGRVKEFKRREWKKRKEFIRDEGEACSLWWAEECARVARLEENDDALTRIVRQEEADRVSEREAVELAGALARVNDCLSFADRLEAESLKDEVAHEIAMRCSLANDTALSKRGLQALQTVTTNTANCTKIARATLHFSRREEAYLWLSSAGSAALTKFYVMEEESRLASAVDAARNVKDDLREIEKQRWESQVKGEGERIALAYSSEKSNIKMLKNVTCGVGKGASEAICRQLRVTAKSNDSPQDRVKLFWEIKSSVDRFSDRKKAYIVKHLNNLVKLQLFKRTSLASISNFASSVNSRRATLESAEASRVSSRTASISSSFSSSVEAESLRVESNYTRQVSEFVKEFSRESQRLEAFRRYLQNSREGEAKVLTSLLADVMNEHKSVHVRHEEFKKTYRRFVKEQDDASKLFYEEFQQLMGTIGSDITTFMKGVTVGNSALFEVIMENVTLGDEESILLTQKAEVFPVHIASVISAMTDLLTTRYLEKSPWTRFPDENSSHYYYYNSLTEESVWENEFTTSEVFDTNYETVMGGRMRTLVTKANDFYDTVAQTNQELCQTIKAEFESYLEQQLYELKLLTDRAQERVEKSTKQHLFSQTDFSVRQKNAIFDFAVASRLDPHSDRGDGGGGGDEIVTGKGGKERSCIDSVGLLSCVSFWNGRKVECALLSDSVLDICSSEERVSVGNSLCRVREPLAVTRMKRHSTQWTQVDGQEHQANEIIEMAYAESLLEEFEGRDFVSGKELMADILHKIMFGGGGEYRGSKHHLCCAVTASRVQGENDVFDVRELCIVLGRFERFRAGLVRMVEKESQGERGERWREVEQKIRAVCSLEAKKMTKVVKMIAQRDGERLDRAAMCFTTEGERLMFCEGAGDDGYFDFGNALEVFFEKVWSEQLYDSSVFCYLSSGLLSSSGDEFFHSFAPANIVSALRMSLLRFKAPSIARSDDDSGSPKSIDANNLLRVIMQTPETSVPKSLCQALISQSVNSIYCGFGSWDGDGDGDENSLNARVGGGKYLPAYMFDKASGNVHKAIVKSLLRCVHHSTLSELPDVSNGIQPLMSLINSDNSNDGVKGMKGLMKRFNPYSDDFKVMSAQNVLDLCAHGNGWHLDEFVSVFDGAVKVDCATETSSFSVNGSFMQSHAVSLISLCDFLGEDKNSLLLLEKARYELRHLGNGGGEFVDYRSLEGGACEIAACAILRRWEETLWRQDFSRLEKGGIGEDKAMRETMNLSKATAQRINREEIRTELMMTLSVNETFRNMNSINALLLNMSGSFEEDRRGRYEKCREDCLLTNSNSRKALDSRTDEEKSKLLSFHSSSIVRCLDEVFDSKASILSAFGDLAGKVAERFNENVCDLMRSCEDVWRISSVEHSRIQRDVIQAAFAKGGTITKEEEENVEELRGYLKGFLADVRKEVKTNNANLAAKELEFDDVEEAENEKISMKLKEICAEALGKAEEMVRTLDSDSQNSIAELGEILREAQEAAAQKMSLAEATIKERVEEEVKDCVSRFGDVDRFSAVSRKISSEIPGIIMHETGEECKKGYDSVMEKLEATEEKLDESLKTIMPRLRQMLDGLAGVLAGEMNKEIVRCSGVAVELAKAVNENIDRNEAIAIEKRGESNRYVKDFFKNARGEFEREEEKLVEQVGEMLVQNNLEEQKIWADARGEKGGWEVEEREKLEAFQVGEGERGKFAGHEKYVSTCKQTVRNVINEYGSKFDEIVSMQAEAALNFSSAQTQKIFQEMHGSVISTVLDNVIDTVEIMKENDSDFTEIVEEYKVDHDVIKSKEVAVREKYSRKMKETFETATADKNGRCDVLLMEGEGMVGRIRLELEKIKKLCVEANKEAVERLEEIEKISAVQKKVMLEEAEAKYAREQEDRKKKLEEEEALLKTPGGAEIIARNRSVILENLATPIKFGDGGFGSGGEDVTDASLEDCVTLSFAARNLGHDAMTPLDNNFFVCVFGQKEEGSKFREVGRTEVVLASTEPEFDSKVMVDDAGGYALLSVWVLRANLDRGEELRDHGVIGDFDFTFEQLLETSRGEMSISLGYRGLVTIMGRKSVVGDLNSGQEQLKPGHCRMGGESMKKASRELVEEKKRMVEEGDRRKREIEKFVGNALGAAIEGVRRASVCAAGDDLQEDSTKGEGSKEEGSKEEGAKAGEDDSLETAEMIKRSNEEEKRDTVAIIENIEANVDQIKHLNNSIKKVKISPEKGMEPVNLEKKMEEEEEKRVNMPNEAEAKEEKGTGGEEEDEEEDVDLYQEVIGGTIYLIEKSSRKVYENTEAQTYVGKLSNQGRIDRTAEDSCEGSIVEEDPDAVFDHTVDQEVDQNVDEPFPSVKATHSVYLVEKKIGDRSYLLEEESGKLYEDDASQKFVGKLLGENLVDFGVPNDSIADDFSHEEMLVEMALEDGNFLVEQSSGKVYMNDDDQSYVGRLVEGRVDRDLPEGGDEGTIEDFGSIATSEGGALIGGGSVGDSVTNGSVYLTEKKIGNKMYLVEDGGKVYDMNQIFVGKLVTYIDINAVNSVTNSALNSTADDDAKGWPSSPQLVMKRKDDNKEPLLDFTHEGTGFLLEKSTGKVFDMNEMFVGKYDPAKDVIDANAVDSDEEHDSSQY